MSRALELLNTMISNSTNEFNKDVTVNGDLAVTGRLTKGGFAPGLEAALDEYMQNGELLKNVPLNALPNGGTSAFSSVSVMVTKGSESFYKTWGVDAITKEKLASDEERPSIFFSQTKLITNMCGLKFWENNVIDLDEPAWKYLPEAHSDGDVGNVDSVYPLKIIRKVLPSHTVVDGKVTVDGVEYDVLTHQVGNYWVGGLTADSPTVQYYLEPVPVSDHPSMRNFMTHSDGFLGYEGFFATLPQLYASAPYGYGHYYVAIEKFAEFKKNKYNLNYNPNNTMYIGFGPDPASFNVSNEATVYYNNLAEFTRDFYEFGLLLQYPGKMMDYGYGNDFVGRLCEVGKDLEMGLTPSLSSQTRFENVLKEKILDPCEVEKFKFYVLPDDPLYDFYINKYQRGTIPAVGDNEYNFTVTPESGGWRYAMPTKVIPAYGGAGGFTTAKEYHKLQYLLNDGRSMNGTRVLRASTIRLITDFVTGSQLDTEEFEKLGKVVFFKYPWSLGGAKSSQLLFPDEYAEQRILDLNKRFDLESLGMEHTIWGGAAGTSWVNNREDDLTFTFQTNTQTSSHRDYLVRKLMSIIMDYSR